MFFTQDDYKKIQQWLTRNSVKDTEFNEALLPLNGNEEVTIVQGNHNKKLSLKDLTNNINLLGASDFVNVSESFNAKYITLQYAISLIPYKSRKLGQLITFLDKDGNWNIYQFKGESLEVWSNVTLWIDVIESLYINSILPDEEDLTMTTPDIQGNTKLKLKDKEYNVDNFSGLGRVYLRKNIAIVEDAESGINKEINLLTQYMMSKPNTIYIIQYDYDLNGAEITIPEGCILDFQGGSFNNTSIILNNNCKLLGNNSLIKEAVGKHCLIAENVSNITIDGIIFDFTNNTSQNPKNVGISISDCNNVTVSNCSFNGDKDAKSGRVGLCCHRVDNLFLNNNKFEYFYLPYEGTTHTITCWATYLNSIKNSIITNNYFYKTYCGIKLTGTIDNVSISNNISKNTITDGLDFAGYSANNIVISNNSFYGGLIGIEFKILLIDDWFDKTFEITRYFKNISISNNVLGANIGIIMQNPFVKSNNLIDDYKQYAYELNSGNIIISNNVIKLEDSEISSSKLTKTGIEVYYAASYLGEISVQDNNIYGFGSGIRLMNCEYVVVTNNKVHSNVRCLDTYFTLIGDKYLKYKNISNNYIQNNIFVSNNGHCIYLDTNTNKNVILNNLVHVTKYDRQTYLVEDLGNGNIIKDLMNYKNHGKDIYQSNKDILVDDEFITYRESNSTETLQSSNTSGKFRINTTDMTIQNIISNGSPAKLQYRCASLPTSPGYIRFFNNDQNNNFVLDVSVQLDRIDFDNIKDFLQYLITKIPNVDKFDSYLYSNGNLYNIIIFAEKYNRSFDAKNYYIGVETDTGASFINSVVDGVDDEIINGDGTRSEKVTII